MIDASTYQSTPVFSGLQALSGFCGVHSHWGELFSLLTPITQMLIFSGKHPHKNNYSIVTGIPLIVCFEPGSLLYNNSMK
jgi:hypothetical protein